MDPIDNNEHISDDKTKGVVTPSRKRRHIDVDKSRDDDEGTLCSVCLDVWTSAGAHRLCALKCGHLFGKSCVTRWLSGRQKFCPQCNAPARKKDIREIYATKLVAVDTNELEDLRLKNSQLKSELGEVKTQLYVSLSLAETYRSKCEKSHQAAMTSEQASSNATIKGFESRILSTQRLDEGMCRVMAYCKQRDVIVVSQEHVGPLWPGFGVRIVSAKADQVSPHQPIHKKELRDLICHPRNPDLLLSVALDQYVKVTDITNNNKTAYVWQSDHRLWSCCWDNEIENVAYVGTERGHVIRLSIENAQEDATTYLPLPLDKIKPVAVIALYSCRKFRSVLCCRLLSVSSYTADGNEFRMQLLQEGKYCAMMVIENSLDDDVIVVLTCRPDGNSARVRHICYKLQSNEANNSLELIQLHVIYCGNVYSQLFRPSLLPIPEGILFFAFDESSSRVCGWLINAVEATKVVTIKTHNAVRDIMAIAVQGQITLYILMPNLLKSYKIR